VFEESLLTRWLLGSIVEKRSLLAEVTVAFYETGSIQFG